VSPSPPRHSLACLNPDFLTTYGLHPVRSGKVRDLYLWRDELWLVASDRISAFDVILPTPLPGKGQILTKLSRFWFDRFAALVPNQVRATRGCNLT
jgi:phosphoribosylaminoimidazole-succinocarboxamide synthase